MKILIFTLFLLLSYGREMLITREYTEYLKKHVEWEVKEYEENPLKGWTVEEAKLLFNNPNSKKVRSNYPEVDHIQNLPSALDWSGAECDQGIRNQGPCGAGWAFAVAGMMSERCCLQGKYSGWLSPQELISCDTKNKGCNGGEPQFALDYITKAKGLVSEYCFSYESKQVPCPKACGDGDDWAEAHKCSCKGPIKSCSGVEGIKSCLISGPATLTFNACKSINYYKIGIYKCDCEPDYVGSLTGIAMGYSTTPSCHIKIKLSLGMTWGNNGYINIDCTSCDIDTDEYVNVICEKVIK